MWMCYLFHFLTFIPYTKILCLYRSTDHTDRHGNCQWLNMCCMFCFWKLKYLLSVRSTGLVCLMLFFWKSRGHLEQLHQKEKLTLCGCVMFSTETKYNFIYSSQRTVLIKLSLQLKYLLLIRAGAPTVPPLRPRMGRSFRSQFGWLLRWCFLHLVNLYRAIYLLYFLFLCIYVFI